jgi:hypothetical protein
MERDNADLLVAQGFHRVEAGLFPGGIHAETDSDQRAHQERREDHVLALMADALGEVARTLSADVDEAGVAGDLV